MPLIVSPKIAVSISAVIKPLIVTLIHSQAL